MRLKGKTAVITGAGSGCGRAAALLFATEGARVACVDIDGNTAKETIPHKSLEDWFYYVYTGKQKET